MKRKEMVEKRTANTKIFENQDHSCTAEIYLKPVHYQDETGTWKEMDDTLSEEKNLGNVGFENRKGKLKIHFAKNTSETEMVSVKNGTDRICWGVEKCRKVKAQKSTDKEIIYPEILNGIDLRCRVCGMDVKEDVILREKNMTESFAYIYEADDFTPDKKRNAIVFLNKEGNEAFRVYTPYMIDAAGGKSDRIEISVEKRKDNLWRVNFKPDREWLAAPDRKYPITIDPVTTTSKEATDIKDAYVSSRNEDENFYNNMYLYLKGGDEIRRSFLKFELPEIETGDMITNARLVMVSLLDNNVEKTIAVHKVLQSWESGTINWNNKPIYEEKVQDLCRLKTDEVKYVTFDITRMVREWYRDGCNYGLMVKELYELKDTLRLMSADHDNSLSEFRPRIEISYVNYSGLEDYWTYHTQSIGRAGTVHVNDFNGNLILLNTIAKSDGSRMPMNLSLVYNTNNWKKNLGYGAGFRLNYHQRLVKKTIAGTEYYLHIDGDGTAHYFVYDAEKKEWKDENGLEFKLTVNTTDAEPYVIEDKEKNTLIFNADGYLIGIRDKNNNKLSITYGNNRITKITDGAGRVTNLIYSLYSDGRERYLMEVVPPSGQKKNMAYASGKLMGITDVDGKKASYKYDSDGILTGAVNADGYQVNYTYNNTMPKRVKTITEYGGDVKGNSLSLAYGYNSTTFTDNKNRTEVYRFDNYGNLLHVHDKFGHAVSGKFNKDGTHVNRLESETKLQGNIVQLFKDPIIQAAKIGWQSKVNPVDAGTVSVNTNPAYCVVGDRSLRAECSSLTGYAYWAQNVQVKKGDTYTASMYVKVSVTKTAEDGGAILRVGYTDKDGKQKLLDSEVIKKTREDFIRLTNTFTLPEDAASDTVKVYMVMWHASGYMYGDMAQLEIGETANRCNLVDNGDFHFGDAQGFLTVGMEPFDGMITVGTGRNMPIQTALIVSASAPVLRATPFTTGAAVATLSKNQHIAGEIVVQQDGKNWYYVRTSDGKKGYLLTNQAVPYLGGTEGLNSGVIAVDGVTLYASASKTSARLEEGINRGTWVSIIKEVTGDDGEVWYCVGMQIDLNRYAGYMPASQVARLCRNQASGKMKVNANLYRDMKTTGEILGNNEAGQIVEIRGLGTGSDGTQWYVITQNGLFCYVLADKVEIMTSPLVSRLRTETVREKVGGLDGNAYRFIGNPEADKKLVKTLDITGKKGDTYMVNLWGCAHSLPETENDAKRRFGVEVTFTGSGGNDVHYTNFSPDILDWQFLSDVYVAKQDYTSIKVAYLYCHNANVGYFDGLSLYREEFGQTYTYDEDNNLISVVDAQKNATKFEYNTNQDMTGIVDAKGNKFTFEYDDHHNVVKGVSAQGNKYRMIYDTVGNVLKSASVGLSNEDIGTWVTRTMTTDENHVKKVMDAGNNTVEYSWDTTKDLLNTLKDARGCELRYAYDEMGRLLSTAQDVTVNGNVHEIKNTYAYTNDRLTAIGHNGFQYRFDYDVFGNTKSASIAGNQVISFEYEPNNGNLLRKLYRNGDYVRYTYDVQDRMLISYFKGAADVSEQKLHEYQYDKLGNLCKVTAHMSGKTYYLFYDFLDRLMRTIDEQGNSWEYQYDVNNNMISMVHTCGTSAAKTSYTYDKDNREVTTKCATNYTRTTVYDEFGGRIREQTWSTAVPYKTSYTYFDSGVNRYNLPKTVKNGAETLTYAYEANGNITSIKDSAGTSTFAYDERNQLIRENNHVLNQTLVYSYDMGGNLISVKEYAFTTEETLPAVPFHTEIGTYDAGWKDQLLNWNGKAMTYDAVGNMLTKGTTTFDWTQGRKLAGVNNGKSIRYDYDHTGARVKKTVDGVTTEYRMAGELLVSEKTGTQTYWYRYDSGANLVSVTIKGNIYFYVRNAQNDIIALIDAAGTEVVKYTYDSWGKLISITGSLADTVGVQNPFRYRGYYYDNETGMYYLKSRYYDPEIRRFICADEMNVLDTGETNYNKNLYSYCDNNALNRLDVTGQFWVTATIAGVILKEIVVPFIVGGVINVASCEIAAKATGQSTGKLDKGLAFISGGISALTNLHSAFGVIGGIVSGGYAGYSAWKRGASDFEIALNSTAAFIGTTGMGNLGGIVYGNKLEACAGIAMSAVMGTGGNLVSSSVYSGIIANSDYKRMLDKGQYNFKAIGTKKIANKLNGTYPFYTRNMSNLRVDVFM